jgi:hypothetical protein
LVLVLVFFFLLSHHDLLLLSHHDLLLLSYLKFRYHLVLEYL